MDPEIITLSVCGKLLEIDLENAWVFLRKRITKPFLVPVSRFLVSDSFLLPVCKFRKAYYCHDFRG